MATKKKALEVEARWTGGRKAASLLKWARRTALIRDPQGAVHFEQKGIEAPESWSQLAVEIAASRYFRKTGTDRRAPREKSIRALVDRIVDAITTSAHRQGIFATKADAGRFQEELKFLLLTQRGAFNSPVWFNVGLWHSYGLRSDSQHFAWNEREKRVTTLQNAFERPQASACFIQDIEDSIEGIFDLARTEAKLFKYGSGTGSNFSKLRSRYEELQAGGTSSGLISFLEVLDRGAGAIKSGGTTRRAAKMVIVDVDHPEILDFIDWKKTEETKARALIEAGWSADFEGPAYHTVSGQNANNSVRVPDRFMKAVEKGGDWVLRRRDGGLHRRIPARLIWDKINQAAWFCADPGLQFHDTINRWHVGAADGEIRGSNPCSEYMYLDDSACNLASLNLVKFFDEDGQFLEEDFRHAVRLLFIAQETLVDFASYPTEKIARNSHEHRPLGLGFANLGSLLMRLAIPYGDERGQAWASALTALMTGEAYRTSVELAKARGPFAAFKRNRKSALKVLRQHEAAAKKLLKEDVIGSLLRKSILSVWKDVLAGAASFGLRNAQATVIAPTGTIGLLMDCDTTGIEPDFSLVKRKKLAGGGEVEIVNQSVKPALRKLGYGADAIERIETDLRRSNSAAGAVDLKESHRAVFACATGEQALSPEDHLRMMAAVQPLISGAISKTVNLPGSATVEDFSRVHLEAWKMGLKSVAVYRDGSKGGQPLSAKKSAPTENPFMKCPECGSATELHSGCYRCTNCGFSLGCA